jgi:DNA repair photolyase
MKPDYQEYQARSVLNVHKHVDGWFYDKYSAHPYVGCAFGCEFCYSREDKYLAGRDPDEFDRLIRVKVNAAEILRRELARQPVDVIVCGDWQLPAERDYGLSRRMLEVVRDFGFPLFIVERSPLLTRDLDLLTEINRRAWVGVVYSISTLDPAVKRAFEPRSPGVKMRLAAMAQLAQAGILVGTALMPVLPVVADDDKHLEEVVVATREHGGRFVLAGGLTMSGPQAARVWHVVDRCFPQARPTYEQLYAGNAYSPSGRYNTDPSAGSGQALARRVRALCQKHGLADRMPRWIEPGPRGVNRWLAERLFHKTYDLELEGADERRLWAYRRAAWTVDEWPTSLAELYASQGLAGLLALPGIGERLARLIAGWLEERQASNVKSQTADGKVEAAIVGRAA